MQDICYLKGEVLTVRKVDIKKNLYQGMSPEMCELLVRPDNQRSAICIIKLLFSVVCTAQHHGKLPFVLVMNSLAF